MARRGETPKYDNKCRDLEDEEIDAKLKEGVPYTIRLRLTPFTEAWHVSHFTPLKMLDKIREKEIEPNVRCHFLFRY